MARILKHRIQPPRCSFWTRADGSGCGSRTGIPPACSTHPGHCCTREARNQDFNFQSPPLGGWDRGWENQVTLFPTAGKYLTQCLLKSSYFLAFDVCMWGSTFNPGVPALIAKGSFDKLILNGTQRPKMMEGLFFPRLQIGTSLGRRCWFGREHCQSSRSTGRNWVALGTHSFTWGFSLPAGEVWICS